MCYPFYLYCMVLFACQPLDGDFRTTPAYGTTTETQHVATTTGAELGRRGKGAAVFLSSCSSKRWLHYKEMIRFRLLDDGVPAGTTSCSAGRNPVVVQTEPLSLL